MKDDDKKISLDVEDQFEATPEFNRVRAKANDEFWKKNDPKFYALQERLRKRVKEND